MRTISAGVQLEMGDTYRESLFAPGCNTRELRKNNTNANFCKLVTTLRKAMTGCFEACQISDFAYQM